MPFSSTDIVFGFVLPALIVAAVLLAAQKWRLSRAIDLSPLALAVGFHLAYWMVGLGPLRPESHWHWIPYVITVAAVISCAKAIGTWNRGARAALILISSAAFAFFLVPTWQDLEPTRSVLIVGWSLTVAGVTLSAESLAQTLFTSKRSHQVLLVALLISSLAGAVVLLLADNLRFSQMAMALAAAIVGLLIANSIQSIPPQAESTLFPAVTAISGLLLIGRVNSFSDVPWISYVLVVIAPLGLWVLNLPYIRNLKGNLRVAVGLSISCIVLGMAVAFAVFATYASQ